MSAVPVVAQFVSAQRGSKANVIRVSALHHGVSEGSADGAHPSEADGTAGEVDSAEHLCRISQDVILRCTLPVRAELFETSVDAGRVVWVVHAGSNDDRINVVADTNITLVNGFALVDDQLDVVHGRGDGAGVSNVELVVTIDTEIDEVATSPGDASSERIAGSGAGKLEFGFILGKIESAVSALSFCEGQARSIDDVLFRGAVDSEVVGGLDHDLVVSQMDDCMDAVLQDTCGDFASGDFFDQAHIGSGRCHGRID